MYRLLLFVFLILIVALHHVEPWQNLYDSVIPEKTPPPNVYLTNDVGYSLETVMAEIQHRQT